MDAIAAQLVSKNVAVIMSAGNDGDAGIGTWNCGPNVIRVGATDVNQPRVPADYSNVSERIPLYAPVGDGDCTDSNCLLAPYADYGSLYVAGTSFASPQVAGAFAVLREKWGPGPSVAALSSLLRNSGQPVVGARVQGAAGSVINIGAALSANP